MLSASALMLGRSLSPARALVAILACKYFINHSDTDEARIQLTLAVPTLLLRTLLTAPTPPSLPASPRARTSLLPPLMAALTSGSSFLVLLFKSILNKSSRILKKLFRSPSGRVLRALHIPAFAHIL
jgi:hypothetical protein